MKNMVGGTIAPISWDSLITLADKGIRERLCDMAAREGVAGLAVFRVEQMDSSQFGRMHFLIYGPDCSLKTIEDIAANRLRDVPSRFAYPFAYWSKS
jgi:hypothetical protein